MPENSRVENPNEPFVAIAISYLGEIDKLLTKNEAWWNDAENALERKFGEAVEESRVKADKCIAYIERQKTTALPKVFKSFEEAMVEVKDVSIKLQAYYEEAALPKDRDKVQFFQKVADRNLKSWRLLLAKRVKPVKIKNLPELNPTTPPERKRLDPVRCWILRINGKNWNLENYNVGDAIFFHSYRPGIGKADDYPHFEKIGPHEDGFAYAYNEVHAFVFSFVVLEGLKDRDPKSEGIRMKITGKYEYGVAITEVPENLLPFANELEGDSPSKLFPISAYQFDAILKAAESRTQVVEPVFENPPHKIALDNDEAIASKDFFFEKDVRAFATILALKNVKPPIAIALFGHWGTGKSFFMNRLNASIENLSKYQCFPVDGNNLKVVAPSPTNSYCEGVVQIKFNAWSYLDSNLWAGLVATILERLDQYINDYTKTGEQKEKVARRLSEELAIVSNRKQMILQEKETLETTKSVIERSIEDEEQRKVDLLEKVRNESLKQIKSEASALIKPELDRLRQKLNDAGISDKAIGELSPDAILMEVRSWTTFAMNLFKLKPIEWIVGLLFLAAFAYVLIDPHELFENARFHLFRGASLVLSLGLPLILKTYRAIRKYKELLTPVIRLRDRFNASVAEVEFQHQKEMGLLRVQLEESNSRMQRLQEELLQIETDIADVRNALENSVTRIAFDEFITARRGDANYEKHLGIISIIRRDFETLSALFQESLEDKSREAARGRDTPGGEPEQAGDLKSDEQGRPKTTEISNGKKIIQGELRKFFKKPLDRIILYIDDLDRCPDEKVVEVLQAVHLLMAFPLFTVVVGVDKRCVYNALMHRNMNQYRDLIRGGDLREELKKYGMTVIEPGEYLEKIFQIPFHLEEPQEASIQEMMHNLLEHQVKMESKSKELTSQLEHNPNKGSPLQSEIAVDDGVSSGESATEKDTAQSTSGQEASVTPAPLSNIDPEALLLSQKEFRMLKDMSVLVGNTPRTIKRFINMYRIVRAHELLSYRKSKEDETFLLIMFTLALSIGDYRDLARQVFEEMDSNKEMSINEFLLQSFNGKTSLSQLNIPTYKDIRKKLDRPELKPLLDMKCSAATNYTPLARRFSFLD